jgi:hypothetical protein
MDSEDHLVDTVSSNKPGNKTPGKGNIAKHKGIVNRPIASSILKAQEEFKLFTANPEDIDHNLYGRFLGILKDAGVPWKVKRLPESREDAMHMMNAIVLAINAYQHYQRDVEECFAKLETTMSFTRTHSHAQATEISKLNNELTKMKKEFTTQTRTLAKESAASREMVSTLKSRLTQAERDINDANTQIRKLRKDLDEEQRRCKALTSQLAAESKPRYSRKSLPPGPSPGIPRPRASTNGSCLDDNGNGRTSEGGLNRSNTSIGRAGMQSPAQAVTESFVPLDPWPGRPSLSPRPREYSGYSPGPYEFPNAGVQRDGTSHRPAVPVSPVVLQPTQHQLPPIAGYGAASPQALPRAPLAQEGIGREGNMLDGVRGLGDGMEEDDSGEEFEGEAAGHGKKNKKNSLKKFMNKLKFSTKEKTGVFAQHSL